MTDLPPPPPEPKQRIDWWPRAIDAAVILLTATMAYGLLYVTVPEGNQGPLNILFGVIVGAFGTVINFHRGSSSGSKASGEVIAAELAKKG
jgi:hypothetical protein